MGESAEGLVTGAGDEISAVILCAPCPQLVEVAAITGRTGERVTRISAGLPTAEPGSTPSADRPEAYIDVRVWTAGTDCGRPCYGGGASAVMFYVGRDRSPPMYRLFPSVDPKNAPARKKITNNRGAASKITRSRTVP